MPWFVYLMMRGSLSEGWIARDGRPNGTLKVCDCTEGVTVFPEGLCNREGKVGDGFFLFINISKCNQMQIGSVPSKQRASSCSLRGQVVQVYNVGHCMHI